jgi:hypothetical protein
VSTKSIQEFTANASPDNWLKYAQELKESALYIWKNQGLIFDLDTLTQETKEHPSISRVFMLCCGLSIENLFKGYLIATNPNLINKGKLDNKLNKHNLINLSQACPDISFEKDEIELMKILSEAIPYWGRYPIPLNFNQIKEQKIASEIILTTFKKLFNKIFQSTLDIIKDGWDAGNGVSYREIIYKSYEDD